MTSTFQGGTPPDKYEVFLGLSSANKPGRCFQHVLEAMPDHSCIHVATGQQTTSPAPPQSRSSSTRDVAPSSKTCQNLSDSRPLKAVMDLDQGEFYDAPALLFSTPLRPLSVHSQYTWIGRDWERFNPPISQNTPQSIPIHFNTLEKWFNGTSPKCRRYCHQYNYRAWSRLDAAVFQGSRTAPGTCDFVAVGMATVMLTSYMNTSTFSLHEAQISATVLHHVRFSLQYFAVRSRLALS